MYVVDLAPRLIRLNHKPLVTVLVTVTNSEQEVWNNVRNFVVIFVRDEVLLLEAVPMEASVIEAVLNHEVVHVEVGLNFVLVVRRADFEHWAHILVVFASKLDEFSLVFALKLADQETTVRFLNLEVVLLEDRLGLREKITVERIELTKVNVAFVLFQVHDYNRSQALFVLKLSHIRTLNLNIVIIYALNYRHLQLVFWRIKFLICLLRYFEQNDSAVAFNNNGRIQHQHVESHNFVIRFYSF